MELAPRSAALERRNRWPGAEPADSVRMSHARRVLPASALAKTVPRQMIKDNGR